MIISEKYSDILVCTYSDKGVKIIQTETGVLYDEAIDEMSSQYTYQETDIPKFE